MEIEKHHFWDCVTGAETLESFRKNTIPKFQFKKEVPEEIIKSFGIVQKLLVHSYYEYDFLDPAMSKALASFEMALKYRYAEITGKKWPKNNNLQNLLYYFNDGNYFEVNRKGLLDALRSMRNTQSHPENYFGGGFGMMRVFNHCVDLINDTYEDRELRKRRIAQKKAINRKLKKLLNNGGMVNDGNVPFIIYEAGIYFLNNSLPTNKYYGFFKMIFRLKEEVDENNKQSDSLFLFEADECEVNRKNAEVRFTMPAGTSLTFTDINKKINQRKYFKWHNQYRKSNDDLMKHTLMNSEIDRQWSILRRALHHRQDKAL